MRHSNYQQVILFLFPLFFLPSCGNGNNAAGNDNSISVNRDSIDKNVNESSHVVNITQKEPLVLEVVTRKKVGLSEYKPVIIPDSLWNQTLLKWAKDPYGLLENESLPKKVILYNGVLFITDFEDAILSNLFPYDSLVQWIEVLGNPHYSNQDTNFWTVGNIGLMLLRNDSISEVSLCWRQQRTLPNDFISKCTYSIYENYSLDSIDNIQYEFSSNIKGLGWYATSTQGIKIVSTNNQNTTIYRNYTNQIYKSNIKDVQFMYVDYDRRFEIIKEAHEEFRYILNSLENAGVASENDDFTMAYFEFNYEFSKIYIGNLRLSNSGYSNVKPIYYIRTHAGQLKWEGEDLFATQSEYDYSTYNLYQNGVDFTSYFNINIDKRWHDWLKEQRAYMALY